LPISKWLNSQERKWLTSEERRSRGRTAKAIHRSEAKRRLELLADAQRRQIDAARDALVADGVVRLSEIGCRKVHGTVSGRFRPHRFRPFRPPSRPGCSTC
jgi:hypothetical protein